MNFLQGFLFCFWLFAFFMQNKNLMRARLCDKLRLYDSFSHHSSNVFSLILTCKISFENGLKSRIQWYNNQNNQMKTIEITRLWTNLPSYHLKPQMYDSVSFSLNNLHLERLSNCIWVSVPLCYILVYKAGLGERLTKQIIYLQNRKGGN